MSHLTTPWIYGANNNKAISTSLPAFYFNVATSNVFNFSYNLITNLIWFNFFIALINYSNSKINIILSEICDIIKFIISVVPSAISVVITIWTIHADHPLLGLNPFCFSPPIFLSSNFFLKYFSQYFAHN